MRETGYMVVGMNLGIVWGAFFARHGQPYTREHCLWLLAEAFVVYTVLVFSRKSC